MKVVVSYSGGKDSQATLLWAVDKYGASNVTAVFCDTGWEHPGTYDHIISTTNKLDVELVVAKSKKYNGMIDLAIKKKRFPSTQARFCTSELKSIPMIDWVLEQKEHLLIIQGIRKAESFKRSKMSESCRFFKYYFEPYGYDKKEKPKFHNYRKKEVLEWCKNYDDSISRPVFNWSGQQVIDFIITKGQLPHELYYQGAKRVGCFPCIMTNKQELRAMIELNPDWIEKVNQAEIKTGSSFFPPTYIPKRFCSEKNENNIRFPHVKDDVSYLTEASENMFKDEEMYNTSCMSFYGLCE